MSELLHETILDLRWGRQTWRVMLLISVPALVAGAALGIGG